MNFLIARLSFLAFVVLHFRKWKSWRKMSAEDRDIWLAINVFCKDVILDGRTFKNVHSEYFPHETPRIFRDRYDGTYNIMGGDRYTLKVITCEWKLEKLARYEKTLAKLLSYKNCYEYGDYSFAAYLALK